MSERFRMDVGDAIILDALGAQVIRTEPAGEIAIMLDLEGRLNKLEIRDAHRYVMSAGQAAELIAEIVVSAQHAAAEGSHLSAHGGRTFAQEMERAIVEEQRRRGLTRG